VVQRGQDLARQLIMLPASRDIWQGHPSTQAWKMDQQQPESITELHHAACGDIGALQVTACFVT